LVVADGPKRERADDAQRCQAVRDLVTNPGWSCDLRVNLAEENLGFNRRISSGLQWAFSQFEEVIIIEDDCLPDPTFFPYCAELLERYRSNDRVMMISGNNYQFGRQRGDGDYYMSHGVGCWGWAAWRRAFQHFDPDMRTWPDERNTDVLDRIWPVPEIVDYWRARLDEAYHRHVDAWDYQWAFAMWRRGGLQIAPNKNLVTYIGCLPDTAHTVDLNAPYCNVPTAPASFPLRQPTDATRNLAADVFEFYRMFLNIEDAEAERRTRDVIGVEHQVGP
jgi:hypothetical protein